jgi:hypothetical protein
VRPAARPSGGSLSCDGSSSGSGHSAEPTPGAVRAVISGRGALAATGEGALPDETIALDGEGAAPINDPQPFDEVGADVELVAPLAEPAWNRQEPTLRAIRHLECRVKFAAGEPPPTSGAGVREHRLTGRDGGAATACLLPVHFVTNLVRSAPRDHHPTVLGPNPDPVPPGIGGAGRSDGYCRVASTSVVVRAPPGVVDGVPATPAESY